MPIPREILNVPRPKNTVVIAYGRDKKLYCELPIKLTLVLRIHSFSSFSSVV